LTNTSRPSAPDDLTAFLRSRRSIRRFKPDPVPVPVIEQLLITATYAPSAHNNQPWRFVAMTEKNAKERLAQAITDKFQADLTADGEAADQIREQVERSRRRILEAPLIVILCRETTAIRPQPDQIRQQAESTMATQSVALAGLQLLLAAEAQGLSGTWICWPLYTSQEIQDGLKLPPTWEPQGMLFIGYADKEPKPKELKPLEEVAIFYK
jgi:coenzyme F420-0:L-glutamate ligase/coenzyme F420-1:gamma-L-glutamate ligase